MIANDAELKAIRERMAELEQLILKLGSTARPEEWPALSAGDRFEIERMQSEILECLVEGAPLRSLAHRPTGTPLGCCFPVPGR